MGYRSNVKLLISKKGFEKLKEYCLKSNKECVKNMVDINTEGLDDFECNCDAVYEGSRYNKKLPKESVMLTWSDVKWYQTFEDVQAVENILEELNKVVEKEPDLIGDYYYKLIEIGEDGLVSEETNDEDNKFVEDFYVIQDFSL